MKSIPRSKSIWIPLILMMSWMSVIFLMSTSVGDWHHSQDIIQGVLNPVLGHPLSSNNLETLNFILRKLAHFSEYAFLLTLIYWGLRSRLSLKPQTLMAGVLFFVILFAISDEYHQSFVPGRTSQLLDVMIDSAGASVTAIATILFEQYRLKRNSSESHISDL